MIRLIGAFLQQAGGSESRYPPTARVCWPPFPGLVSPNLGATSPVLSATEIFDAGASDARSRHAGTADVAVSGGPAGAGQVDRPVDLPATMMGLPVHLFLLVLQAAGAQQALRLRVVCRDFNELLGPETNRGQGVDRSPE